MKKACLWLVPQSVVWIIRPLDLRCYDRPRFSLFWAAGLSLVGTPFAKDQSRDRNKPRLLPREQGTEFQEGKLAQADRAAPAAGQVWQTPREQEPENRRLRKEAGLMTIQNRLPWRRSVTGVVLIGGLVLLLIADCISAFSTLVWDPVTEPRTTADVAVVLDRFSQDQPNQPRRVENSGQYLGP